ncbi:hypothetical protein CHS0354_034051 [Potamilus streckersoni]|uniref:Uncharacterized protein n=1 Tax=Potamilus streckersoni TaxID=2493646 RepID=A0AAE0SIW4_9BIVA|nr:hypothetical protein CHS0354_034051 [Potamilus streckersoni]
MAQKMTSMLDSYTLDFDWHLIYGITKCPGCWSLSIQIHIAVPSPDESLGLPVAGLAGGISAGLVVIFIMGIGIVLWRRNQHKKRNELDNDVSKEHKERRSKIKDSSVQKDEASGKEYEGLHFKETEANQYLQLHGITLEENRNVDIRSPESDSYEQLHPYVNKDIQMYSSLNISKTLKDAEQKYENAWIKTPDTPDESNKIFDRSEEDIV